MLILLLIFLSLGGEFSYGFTSEEFRSDDPFSETNFAIPVGPTWAIMENPFQKISDPSENYFSGSFSSVSDSIVSESIPKNTTSAYFFRRDLRSELTAYIFPTHFFT
ncbi:hypothetical protein [Salinimicrobium flavum]|uniref:Uncharacterized protein n=1 Tax=Salinimicrobium flavum TaxID=1737065 RepID=A0ABW5IUS6_9FLAO